MWAIAHFNQALVFLIRVRPVCSSLFGSLCIRWLKLLAVCISSCVIATIEHLSGQGRMQSSKAQNLCEAIKDDYQDNHLPTCPVCMERLGTYGGPSSLPCGHNGCLHCLQQVQAHKNFPLCPLCRTPFDAELSLGPNLDFKHTLEKLQLASSATIRVNEGALYEYVDEFPHQRILAKGASVAGSTLSQSIITTLPNEHSIQQERDTCSDMVTSQPPAINVWNLVRGTLAIMSKVIRPPVEKASSQDSPSDRSSFNENGNNLWASVHLPTAPPMQTCQCPGEEIMVLNAILESEPPQWIPDSSCCNCMQCGLSFQPLTRGRHHCRLCGGIFCRGCSKGRCLMPVKFMEKEPQRVCDSCYERLEPVQHILIQSVSNAAQVAIHDVTDSTCMRGWLNSPLGTCMQDEIYKATNTLRTFCKIGRLKPENSIPEAVLQGAKGLAILTVAKVGVMLTYKLGTGLIVARRGDGSWSPPAAIISCGLGWGLQVGGELIDFILVLRSEKALKAFSSRLHLSVGAALSASAGPLGRLAGADLCVGNAGAATCYTYSCCQGAFVGVSFEGNVVGARVETNAHFYGDIYLTPDDILFGTVPVPRAAAPLYKALHELVLAKGM